MSARPAWLTARPIAHRGLHRASAGVIENTPSAAHAAIGQGFSIECDVQITSDGEAMVFHDFTLDRLTRTQGRLDAMTAAAIGAVDYKATADRIVTLGAFLDLIAGRVPLVCEIKSDFNGDMRLTERTAAVVAAYSGPVALKSFDPDIVAHLRREGARLGVAERPTGIVAEAHFDHPEWAKIPAAQRREMGHLLHWDRTKPDFVSWSVKDLPHAAPFFARKMEFPVMTWTVRTPPQIETARSWADQMVFEGFMP